MIGFPFKPTGYFYFIIYDAIGMKNVLMLSFMFGLCHFEDIFCEQFSEKSILLVISQKGKPQNSGYKKAKHVNLSQ